MKYLYSIRSVIKTLAKVLLSITCTILMIIAIIVLSISYLFTK
nr:MAG TPA: hypothetical protein [Caudoviricetes sp.]